PAMGIISFAKNSQGYLITPWVWVEATKSMVKEGACVSGSIALAWVLQAKSASILQPSGSRFEVSFGPDQAVSLTGEVEFLGERGVESPSGFLGTASQSREPLVDLSALDFILEPVYFNQGFSLEKRMFLREGAAKKLQAVQNSLKNYKIKIWD